MSLESEARSGKSSTSRNEEVIEKVRQSVLENRRQTLTEIAEEMRINRGSAHSILTEDSCRRRVSAKSIPQLLTEQQKELRVEIAQNMMDCANNDLEFAKTIITDHETWVYGYNSEIKFKSSQWIHPESPRPKKARQVRSNVKVMPK